MTATETMLSGASGATAHHEPRLAGRGKGVLMCGGALYSTGDRDVFVWGTAPTDPHLLHATKPQLQAAGCDDSMVTFR